MFKIKYIKKSVLCLITVYIISLCSFNTYASTYIAAHWRVMGENISNNVRISSEDAYSGNNSAHIYHTDESDAELKFLPFWAESNNAAYNVRTGYTTEVFQIKVTYSFKAKGILPDNAYFQVITTNGKMNATANRSAWTVGEPDGNGWYDVSMTAMQNWNSGTDIWGAIDIHQGYTGLHIMGDCDFYADDFRMYFQNAKSWVKWESYDVFDDDEWDPGFENAGATEGLEVDVPFVHYDADAHMLTWGEPADHQWTDYVICKVNPKTGNIVEIGRIEAALSDCTFKTAATSSPDDIYIVKTYTPGTDFTSQGTYSNAEHNKEKVKYIGFDGSDFSLTDGDMNILKSSISAIEEGYVTASISLEDIRYTGQGRLFAALYNYGRLKKIVFLDVDVGSADKNGVIKTTLKIPEVSADDSYSLKVFFWDDNMTPLSGADRIIGASAVDIRDFDDADIGGGSVNADPLWFADNN